MLAERGAGGDQACASGEHLCRYIARPPISTERLTLDERGRIPYRLRHPYRDGTTHIVFTPTSFLERLCALIPRPCKHLLSYHGVLAPASSWRPEIIPRGAFESVPGTSRPTTRTSLERRLRWAELIRRVFDADVLHCECGARRRVIATITDRRQVRTILRHLGLEDAAPISTPSRAPPLLEFAWPIRPEDRSANTRVPPSLCPHRPPITATAHPGATLTLFRHVLQVLEPPLASGPDVGQAT